MPPIFLGAALVFWGWQAGFLPIAIPLALGLELAHLNRAPWVLQTSDFRRMANLCMVLLVLVLGSLVISAQWTQAVYRLLQWLPLVFLPLLLAQVLSTQDRVPVAALFLLLSRDELLQKVQLDLRYPYFGVCVLGASAGQDLQHLNWPFYFGMTTLVMLLLGNDRRHRAQRFSWGLWAISVTIALGLGVWGHLSLHQLHLRLEAQAIEWLSGLFTAELDPFRRDTAIGDVGSLKLSNAIRFRVQGEQVPSLLQEASYNLYQSGFWIASQGDFLAVAPDVTAQRWQFNPQTRDPRDATPTSLNSLLVIDRFPQGKGLLKLPLGAVEVDQLPALGLERNPYGTVRLETDQADLRYRVLYSPDNRNDRLTLNPVPSDLDLPLLEKAALMDVLHEMALNPEALPPLPQVLDALSIFFETQFAYSLDLLTPQVGSTALTTFLTQARSGHCEYFATAATLLLRTLGFSSRYAVGYAVHEFSPLEGQYVVRDRHAHAWTLVYDQDHWITFDPTPGSWRETETEAVPLWAGIGDLGSWLRLRLNQGVQTLRQSSLIRRWWWVLIPTIGLTIAQLRQRQRIRTHPSTRTHLASALPQTGSDSPFYTWIAHLEAQGGPRQPPESLGMWIDRLAQENPEAENWPELRRLLTQHYAYRFDGQQWDISAHGGVKPTAHHHDS